MASFLQCVLSICQWLNVMSVHAHKWVLVYANNRITQRAEGQRIIIIQSEVQISSKAIISILLVSRPHVQQKQRGVGGNY